jgi:hypothetical protein
MISTSRATTATATIARREHRQVAAHQVQAVRWLVRQLL